MIRRLGEALSRLAGRYLPEPFTIALLLTLVTFVLAGALSGQDPLTLIGLWGGPPKTPGAPFQPDLGLWALLVFGMQMCLILVTGYALARAPVVHRGITWLAARPRTQASAIATTALTAMICALVHWGLGLIVGALLAREVAAGARARGLRVHYPLLGAAGYTGLMVWHGGLSGSAPFSVTTQKGLASLGLSGYAPVPLTETTFSLQNGAISLALLVLVPLLLVRMAPRAEADIREIRPPDAPPYEGDEAAAARTPAGRLERSPVLTTVVAVGLLAYLWQVLDRVGVAKTDLDAINLFFLAVGLLLHGSARSYGQAISEAASGCGGILLQFPFYAAIMALMKFSGLSATIAAAFAHLSGAVTFEPLTFLSAGVVNLFVPSGGGQWAVQGGVILEAARTLHAPPGGAVMAFAYGDAWTNMLQPFWALPLLAITGLKARELIGYTAALMCLTAPVYLVLLAVL